MGTILTLPPNSFSAGCLLDFLLLLSRMFYWRHQLEEGPSWAGVCGVCVCP